VRAVPDRRAAEGRLGVVADESVAMSEPVQVRQTFVRLAATTCGTR